MCALTNPRVNPEMSVARANIPYEPQTGTPSCSVK